MLLPRHDWDQAYDAVCGRAGGLDGVDAGSGLARRRRMFTIC